MLLNLVTGILIIGVFLPLINGDTPANCTYDDVQGTWIFSESERSSDKSEICNGSQPVVNKIRIDLLFPDVAVDQYGNKGIH